MANNTIKQVSPKQIFPDIKNFVNTSTGFTQGDHAIFDTVSGLVRAPTAEAEGQYYIGVEALSVTAGVPIGPYSGLVDLPVASIPSVNGPIFGNVCKFTLQTGMSASAGCAIYVYPTGGAQFVSSTGTKQIGVFEGPSITNAASGTFVNVLVGSRYPGDTLKF